MTDETRPETTPSTPDADTPGSEGMDDSLESWFRPARVAEREQEQERERGLDGNDASTRAAEGGSALKASAGADAVESSEESDEGESADRAEASGDEGERADLADPSDRAARADEAGSEATASDASAPRPVDDRTQVIPAAPTKPADGATGASSAANADSDRTQVFAVTPAAPANPVAAAPTQAIPRPPAPSADTPSAATPSSAAPKAQPADSDMAVRPSTPRTPESYGGAGPEEHESWSPEPGPQPQYQPTEHQPAESEPARYKKAKAKYQQGQSRQPQRLNEPQTQPYEAPGGVASILPPRGHTNYDDFDNYSFADGDGAEEPPRSRGRRALMAIAGVFVLVVAVAAALVFSGKVHAFGIGAKPVPTVGFSPSGSDAGSDATQTGTAFLTDWENGNIKAAANITDNQSAALAALTAYKNDLKVSGLTLMPGTASAQGWMTFNATAQVGTPSSAWSYSSGLATYSSTINGYTRWFVKWQPSLLFTELKSGQKLALGPIPPVANKVVDKNGTEITPANAPSLGGIVNALKKSAPPAAGTPGQQVQIENADGSFVSKVVKLTDPVTTGAVKTTLDLNVEKAAQSAVNSAPNSSMVVIQPSTGNILAVANNPTGGLDTAMLGRYAPGSTFKTITTTLVLNKGIITDLNQTWDCPATLNADGITLHNSEQEVGVGNSFLKDFAQSCNNAFSRFEGKVSKTDLASTAHDYYGFDQKWDVGLNAPVIYGHVPTAASNSLAEELVGQDQIQASPLTMASVAATIDSGSFKQPILVPGTSQIPAAPLAASTDQSLKTLMHQVVVDGTLAGILPTDVYAKTGTAEVGGGKQPNSWTIAFRGDYAVAALSVGGGFGATTAGPEVKSLLAAVH